MLLPSLLEVFTSWRELFDLSPAWVAVALDAEAVSLGAIWELQRIALESPTRPPVALSRLAGNALGRVIPGSGAAAAALQFRMLQRAGSQDDRSRGRFPSEFKKPPRS